MEPTPETLPNDIEALRARLLAERAERVRLDAQAQHLQARLPG